MTADFHAGSQIGAYVLDFYLGGGNFGAVWRGHSIATGVPVAVKLLNGNLAAASSSAMRADIEMLAAAAAAQSEHVVKMLDGGMNPVPYVVMEFIDGRDISSLISEQGRLTVRQTIDVGIGVSDALRALLDAGIIHRDIKPANVMVDSQGVVKLADFGIAKIVGYETMTQAGNTAMTMAYAAPEVWDDSGPFGKPDHRSDLYAMGVVLYQCLTGTAPFSGNVGALFKAHTEQPADLTRLPPETPSSLRLVIRRCLEKRQQDRPATAAECLTLLQRAESELAQATGGSATSEPAHFGHWIKDTPHESQPWAWRCHHESNGSRATVEVSFTATLEYAQVLRQAVAVNRQLVPLGAERFIETNRLLLRPNEAWYAPPPGQFQFWLAREDREAAPAPRVTPAMLRIALPAISFMIDIATREGISLDLHQRNLTLKQDGSIYLRRPGLTPLDPNLQASALAYVRSLPLDPESKQMVDGASDFARLVALVRRPAPTATDLPRQQPQDSATVVRPPRAADQTVVMGQSSGIAPRPFTPPPPLEITPPQAPPPPPPAAPPVATEPPLIPPWRQRETEAPKKKSRGGLVAVGLLALVAAIGAAAFLITSSSSSGDSKGANNAVGKGTPGAQSSPGATPGTTPGVTATVPVVVPPTAAPPVLQDAILFVSTRSGSEQIYQMNVDGTNVKQLTTGPAANRLPNATPDGSQIAFISERDGGSELYVMAADGSKQRRLPFAPNSLKYEPNFTSDGKKIVVEAKNGDHFQVFTINADGTNPTNLTNAAGNDIDPVWSPDGKRIVFGSDREGNMEIHTMNADGTGRKRLTAMKGFNGEPAWSPDGKSIVFESDSRGNYDLYVMNEDGTNLRRITSNPGNEMDPAWSPDGKTILYSGMLRCDDTKAQECFTPTVRTGPTAFASNEVFQVNADGTAPKQLTSNIAEDLKPAWTKIRP